MYLNFIICGLGLLAGGALLRRQSVDPLAFAPPECYAIFNNALIIAQNAGYTYLRLCAPDTDFQTAADTARECVAAYNDSATTSSAYPALQSVINWCSSNSVSGADESASRWFSCWDYGVDFSTYPSNCSTVIFPQDSTSSTLEASSTPITTDSSISTTADSSISSTTSDRGQEATPTASSQVTEAPAPSEKTNKVAIAGGTVGGGVLLGSVLGVVLFIHRRRRKQQQRSTASGEPHEEPQLPGDDIKPDRKELIGGKVPQAMLEKPNVLIELPANEEVRRHNGSLEEMVGQEMEPTENWMRALDRLTDTTEESNSRTSVDYLTARSKEVTLSICFSQSDS